MVIIGPRSSESILGVKNRTNDFTNFMKKNKDKLKLLKGSSIILHYQNISIANLSSDTEYHSGYLPKREGTNRNITLERDGGWAVIGIVAATAAHMVILALERAW